MLYTLLKIFSRILINIYCRKIKINKKGLLQAKGPLILACNHPNSFLDAVILATLFDKPLYSLARGDVFKKKKNATLLHAMNILPVYREREGTENLHLNYGTFDECLKIFKQNGIVLIFIEAASENEWKLRPLKKGTARLALAAWEQNIPVKILPVGLNYNSFKLFGKNLHINFGEIIQTYTVAASNEKSGKLLNELTASIEAQLKKLVYAIDKNDVQTKENTLSVPLPIYKKMLLALPAVAGFVVYFPLYYPAKIYFTKKFGNTGHYDSVMTMFLFFAYPLYLISIALLVFIFACGCWWLLTFILFPFFAWSHVQLNKQID